MTHFRAPQNTGGIMRYKPLCTALVCYAAASITLAPTNASAAGRKTSAPAAAAPSIVNQYEKEAAQAKEDFDAKLFEKAAWAYLHLFELTGKPAMLYNAGRAYEALGNLWRAIEIYDRVKNFMGAADDMKLDAAARYTALKARVAAVELAEATARQKLIDLSHAPTATVRESDPPAAAPELPLVKFGAATVLGVASLTTYIVARGTASDALGTAVVVQADKDRYDGLVRSARTEQFVSIGLAVAAVGIGAWGVWDYLGPPSQAKPPTASKQQQTNFRLAPTATPGYTGIVFSGSF